ncbi:MAG: hypothetical protein KJO44_01675 [Gemmatimonadetes bacterium]|nr:hypothetical protein [Gemmatimonadota bacterium]MBT8479509.1 hypothetical protein [Gemmatimonadota bacterium]NNK49040.1 hypothetical protein [Gemmatimonadota bacterium]
MIKNCLARVGCLALILVVVAGGWLFRDDLAGWWRRLEITSASQPSEDLAERATQKLEAVTARDGMRRLELSQAEIQSLLTYRAGPLLPAGITEPVVELRDSTVLLSARVDPRGLEGLASPEVVERLFSDSAKVVVELWPGVLTPGVARVEILTLQAGSIVVPSMMVPWILESIEMPGVETTGVMLLLPTPGRVADFEVESGKLVLELTGADGD